MDGTNEVGDFTQNEYFDPEDPKYTINRDVDTLLVDPFKKSDAGKYFSVITRYEDGSPREVDAILAPTRYKIRFTYIKKHGEIEDVLITKYKYNRKREFIYDGTEGLKLPYLSYQKIFGLFKFLSSLDLPSIDAKKLQIESTQINADEDTVKQLKTILATDKGKDIVNFIYSEGLLRSDLDIPELIKKGLSHEKIEEKLSALDSFEKLIGEKGIKEVADIQTELRKMPWIFGPEYETLDVRGAGEAGIPDARLKRIDGMSDVLEIKLPSEELFREDTQGRQFASRKLSEAIGQLTGYLEYYYSEYRQQNDDETSKEILTDTRGNYYRPKGFLLIGRREIQNGTGTKTAVNADPKRLRRFMAYTHWIEILTYDDLIERARHGLNNLLKGK